MRAKLLELLDGIVVLVLGGSPWLRVRWTNRSNYHRHVVSCCAARTSTQEKLVLGLASNPFRTFEASRVNCYNIFELVRVSVCVRARALWLPTDLVPGERMAPNEEAVVRVARNFDARSTSWVGTVES